MDLEDCSLITDATIHSLSTNCSNLSELVSASYLETACGSQQLCVAVERSPFIPTVFQSLSHCELITDESIHCLCTNNKDKLLVRSLSTLAPV